MNEIQFKVTGLRETKSELDKLDRRLRSNIVRRALRRGLNVVLQPLKAAAYERNVRRTGLLAASMAVRIQRLSKKTEVVRGILIANDVKGGRGIRFGGQAHGALYKAFYWRFLEYGTNKRAVLSRKGANRGRAPRREWAKPVAVAHAGRMVEAFRDAVAAGIDQELQRNG